MPKKLLQDMVPDESRRSIRRISIDHSRRQRKVNVDTEENDDIEEETEGEYDPPQRGGLPVKPLRAPKKRRSWLIWGLAVLVVIILIVVIFSTALSGASVLTYPRQEVTTIDGQFKAGLEDVSPDSVPFEVMTITRTGVEEVEATGQSQVDRKASGQIIIENDFSAESQRLINNTRFESPDGLIYRIDKSVVVPGKTENGPGSIEVTVFADTSGDEYNIGLVDFTVPGLASDSERFAAITAKSKTPMANGFSGIESTVSPADLTSARTAIQNRLKTEILAEAVAEVPDGYVLYEDSMFIDFSSLANAPTENNETVLVREEATLYGLIFKSEELSKFIAENTIASYDGSPVEAIGLEGLELTIVDKSLIDPSSVEEFEFTLSGSSNVVWLYDSERLMADLAGKHRRDVETVFSGYPAIETADISLRPFWKRSFPSNTEDIDIDRSLNE